MCFFQGSFCFILTEMFALQFYFSVVTFTQERVEQLQQLSKQPDIYERLAKALGKTNKISLFLFVV